MIKFPVDTVWDTMLHHLPEIAKDVDDLESITEIKRINQPGGAIKVESVWKAKPKLPGMVMKYIKPDMLEWTDSANWKEKEKMIEWEIHSHHYYDELYCKGVTAFERAMGGKGCKLTFSGELEWKGKVLSMSLGMFDSSLAKGVESILSQMIPSNLRKITDALSKYIEKNAAK
jgi:hypothetical protein